MPRGQKKRFYKRRRFYRKKKITAMSALIPNSKRMFRCKLIYSLIVSQRGTIGVNYPQVIVPLNFPNIAYTDDGSFTAALDYISHNANNKFPDLYTSLLNAGGPPMFDQYKVNSLKVRFIPNTLDVNIVESASYTLSVYQYNDPDDVTALNPATIEQRMLGGGILPKCYNIVSQRGLNWKYKQNKEGRSHWLNTSLIQANAVPTPGTNPTLGAEGFPSMFGSMKLVFQNYNAAAAPATLGRCFVEWDITFRGISSTL